MRIPSIDDVRGRPDPQLSWRWACLMPDLPGSNAKSPPLTYVERIPVSHVGTDPKPRHGGATNRYYPQLSDISAVNVQFYEDENHLVDTYLDAWRDLVYDGDGNYGLPADYKLPIVIMFYTGRNGQSPNKSTILEGCWPAQRDSEELGFEESGKLIVSQLFSVDNSVPRV